MTALPWREAVVQLPLILSSEVCHSGEILTHGEGIPLSVNQPVEVLVAQPFDWSARCEAEPLWTPGFVVTAIVGASDREYRVDVLAPGKTDRWGQPLGYRGCAPECVQAVCRG